MRRRDAEREIRKWKKHFRILANRDIEFDNDGEYEAQSNHGTLGSVIYDYPGVPPEDFIFHEMCHVCMAVIRHMKAPKEKRQAEELFIQDLCVAMFKEP